jgi:hypothetical protein
MKRLLFLFVMLVVLLFGVSAHASLVDMNDGTIYDTDTQLSWLKDAGAGGLKTWADANTWAAGLNTGNGFAGLTGWRVPNADPTCGNFNYYCINSEMGHLFYTELGNQPGAVPFSNAGPFTGLQPNYYWTGAVYVYDPTRAYVFIFHSGIQVPVVNGMQAIDDKVSYNNSWAVSPGARTPCTSSTDGAWGACVNGIQTRTVIGYPAGCTGGVQLDATTQACSSPTPTPVGYNLQWLLITLVSLMGAGGFLLRRRTARQ